MREPTDNDVNGPPKVGPWPLLSGKIRSCPTTTISSVKDGCTALCVGGHRGVISTRLRAPPSICPRSVRSVKQECLSKLILFSEGSLSRVLTEYGGHYHHERNHQGKGNRLLFPDKPEKEYLFSRNIVCRQRLGGLLKYYQRAA
jgi:hypothetical protein